MSIISVIIHPQYQIGENIMIRVQTIKRNDINPSLQNEVQLGNFMEHPLIVYSEVEINTVFLLSQI